MDMTSPTRQESRVNSVTQAVMPFARALALFAVFYCVLVASRETFYPNLPRHSPELTLTHVVAVWYAAGRVGYTEGG